MKRFEKVRGSKEASQPIVIGKDTIYIHENVKKIEEDEFGNKVDNIYEYDEIQYDKDEYMAKLIAENSNLKKGLRETNAAIESIMTDMIPNTVEELPSEGGEE